MSNGTDRRIDAVVFDAMYTVISAKGSRKRLLARVFSDHLGKRVTAKRVMRITEDVRRSAVLTRDYHRDWPEWNRRIIAELRGVPSDTVPLDEGLAVHLRILSDVSLYEVTREMHELLAFAKDRFRLAIASNQSATHLIPMMEHLGIMGYFERVFTSDELGVSKPFHTFFEKVYAELGVDAGRACYVGNSIRNDLSASHIGSPVVLFDRSGGLAIPESGGGHALVRVVRSLPQLYSWLDEQRGVSIPPPEQEENAAAAK